MDSTGIGLFCILAGCCIFLTRFFSRVETALAESRKSRLEHLEGDGDARAKEALRLLDAPETLLSAAQIGAAFTSVLLGAAAGALAVPTAARTLSFLPYPTILSLAASVLVTAYVGFLFGEFLPKKAAAEDPEAILIRGARTLSFLERLARPFVAFLARSGETVMLLLGMNTKVDDAVTEDEVKDLIEQGTEDGTFEKTEQAMVDRIFHMSDQTAYALMTPRTRMDWLDITDPPDYNLRLIQKNADTVYPVGDGNLDNFLGIIYAKDLLNAAIDRKKLDLRAFIRKPLFVPRAMETFRVLEKFRESRVHEAIVLDEYGGVIGFITLGDIVEEIIGDTQKSDEPENPRITPRSENSWYVDGLCSIDDFKEKFGLDELPNEAKDHYQTMGGFLTSYFGYIPKVGEKCTWDEFAFEILRLDRARIARLSVVHDPAPALAAPKPRGG